ncbi:MAG TPA: hypothetical protein VN903_08170 [Polyangia bacterium]|nr:hypothetical protein [Polyangia bacterium]
MNPRLRNVLCVLGLAGLVMGALPLAGCRKKIDPEPVKQSLAALKVQLGELKTKFMALREKVEAIPPDLDGFGDARARFYAAEEGRGVTDGKAAWLSSRLDAAVTANNGEELQSISKDIAATYDDIRRIDEMYVKLLHQIMSFERKANQQKAEAAAVAATAPPAAPAPNPKPKRSKSKP